MIVKYQNKPCLVLEIWVHSIFNSFVYKIILENKEIYIGRQSSPDLVYECPKVSGNEWLEKQGYERTK